MRKYFLNITFLFVILAFIVSCQSQEQMDMQNYISSGRDIYKAKCQNCHGENGEGLGELSPPLTDSVFLKANKTRLACFIKNGANETLVIHGKEYKEKMPAFTELTDIEIAQVIVFVTNSFGNKQGFYNYNKVNTDLKNCK